MCVHVAFSLLLARSRLSPVNRVDRLVSDGQEQEPNTTGENKAERKRKRDNTSLSLNVSSY